TGCCSLSTRQAGSTGTGQDEMELLKTSRTGICLVRLPEEMHANVRLFQTEVLWGRRREELANLLITQPISGWEGMNIHSLGEIIWSSLVFLRSYCMEEMCECYIVLSSFHLLILSVDHTKKAFVYEHIEFTTRLKSRWQPQTQGLSMFLCAGSMIESRLICCQNSADFDMWVQHLQHQIKMANTHCPVSPNNNISFLVSQCRRDVKGMG
ncbi:ARHG7 factor, partial [Fregetta grallaria]|nr:ARHG7 factor [Fregetta grallaria]